MAASVQTVFLNPFSSMKMLQFHYNFTAACLYIYTYIYTYIYMIDSNSVLAQTIVWRRTGDRPLSEPKMAQVTYAYSELGMKITPFLSTQTAMFMGPTGVPPGSCRLQLGPMLAL